MKLTIFLSTILYVLTAVPATADDNHKRSGRHDDGVAVGSTADDSHDQSRRHDNGVAVGSTADDNDDQSRRPDDDVEAGSTVDKNGASGADFAASAEQADANMQAIFDQVRSQMTSGEISAATGNLCAIAVIPGPADSFNIRYGLFNVISTNLDFVIVDTFRALGGQSLLTEVVFNTTPPLGGTLTDHYPDGAAGKGPIVLGLTSFGQFDAISFNTDPDTYNDPGFGATVLDMDNTDIEAVYSDGIRCKGTLRFDKGLNASIATVVQVFP